MHEGLVVISQNDQSLQFASKPARKLLMENPQQIVSQSETEDACFDSSYILKRMFEPTRVSLTDVHGRCNEP